MAEVERKLREFVSAFEMNGDADPQDYLADLEGVDRDELEALIDAYLDRAPPRGWNSSGYNQSGAAELTDRLHAALAGTNGLWPSLLPQLRMRAKLKRSEVVARLASEIGHSKSKGRVESYYHEMESGLLPSEGVSTKVLEALASILDWTAEGLRTAGRAFPGGGQVPEEVVFSRIPGGAGEVDAPTPERQPPQDDLDELFLGGGND